MKHWLSIFALLLVSCSSRGELAEPTPPADKPSAARLIAASEKAKAAVAGSEATLSDDSQFVIKLRAVLKDDALSTQDKVEAFYLMLRAVGWAFNGSMALPQGVSYHDYCGFQIFTYYKWHQALAGEGFSGTEFLRLAERRMLDAEPLAAHSLLLAGIIDGGKAEAGVKQILVNSNESTPLLLHNAIAAAALTRSEDVSAELAALLKRVQGEELLEDVICGLSMMNTRHSYMGISGFVTERAAKRFDQEVETGLHAMRAHMDPATFASFFAELVARVSDPEAKQQLTEFRDRGFAYSLTLPSMATKVWDGFAVSVYGDGMAIASKSTLDFVPNSVEAGLSAPGASK